MLLLGSAGIECKRSTSLTSYFRWGNCLGYNRLQWREANRHQSFFLQEDMVVRGKMRLRVIWSAWCGTRKGGLYLHHCNIPDDPHLLRRNQRPLLFLRYD